jgi:hypothetical protein
LGRKDVFNRRVTDSKCFNGNDRVRQVTTEDCACDRSDYQVNYSKSFDILQQNLKNSKFSAITDFTVPTDGLDLVCLIQGFLTTTYTSHLVGVDLASFTIKPGDTSR